MIWKVLEIEKTKDEEQIKAAYRNKLRHTNPEDDAEAFKELRRAYEQAMEYANQSEEEEIEKKEQFVKTHKSEIDLWIDRVDAIYQDVRKRRNGKEWDLILHDSVCEDLDTELEATEKLLVYFMSHSFMPQEIWKMVDARFHFVESYDQLKEKFPENYLDYIKWQIENPNFIDFDLFEGKLDSHIDDYINTLYEEKNVFEEGDMEKVSQLLEKLAGFEVKHPYTKVEEARYLLKKGKEDKQLKQEALSIMEELDFEYSENTYVEHIYAQALLENDEFDKAEAIYDDLLERIPEHYGAMLGKANCIFLKGNLEDAKERIEDILEDRVQDTESLELLTVINEKLVKEYETALETNLDREICFKLGWCYYQQKEFEKGIRLLDRLKASEDYDYINLRCRLCLANEDYEQAYPLAKKWISLIEASEDDGSREMQKRKNRLSLANFSIGVCIWEIDYRKNKNKNKKKLFAEKSFEEAVFYIEKAIGQEQNTLVRLSYMEQLARFYLEEDEYRKCIRICDEIIQADAGFFPAYVHRQKANYELKNAKEVIDDFFLCKEIYPVYSRPYVLAADVFMAFEQYDDVENVLEDAKQADIKSCALELNRIKCIHYKEFSTENVQKALEAILELKKKMQDSGNEYEMDIENPVDVERELAILYWDLEQTDKTIEIIDGYLEKNPDVPAMLHLKVDVLNRRREHDEALEICKKLSVKEPDNLYTRMKLGNCYERVGEDEMAIKCYKRVLKENESYVPAIRRLMYEYSYLSNQENDLKKCKLGIYYATRLIELTNAAEGYVERGNLYIDLYELEKSVEDCKKAIELDPEEYYAYNNLGCALIKLRRLEEAILPLEHIIHKEPERDHLPYMNLAECYILQKEYDKAIKAYENVMQIRPDMLRIKKKIAEVYALMKEYDKAILIYKELLEKVSEKEEDSNFFKSKKEQSERMISLYEDIADVYRQAKDEKNAEKYYKKVLSIFFSPFTNCSETEVDSVAAYYRNKGMLKEAADILKRAAKKLSAKGMQKKDVYFTLATVMFELGKKIEAKKYANFYLEQLLGEYDSEEEFLSDARYLPMHLYDLGMMSICKGDLKKGKCYFERIRQCKLCMTCKSCDCFEYYFGMGLIAELEGRKEEAENMYKKALEIDGDYPYCESHLKNLQ